MEKIQNIIKEISIKKDIPKNLLSTGISNSKTAKNSLKTFILYLAPYNQNSKKHNLCPMASKGCAAACLFTAGRGVMTPVIAGRVKKTEYFIRDKKAFINQLAQEIEIKCLTAYKRNEKIAFRLNGTSDIDFIYLLEKYAKFDISKYKDVAFFYDYTKLISKIKRYKNHVNYFLTFSRSEENESAAIAALNDGANVAAVFRDKLPNFWRGYKVINGDRSDLEMIYNKNVVLGLKAKGEAKKDKSGFVI
ncbi:MAG: hypothetical protein Tp1102MES256162_38 [Prokaryotic dsDNA virus sp.]|nr:MAG: hypothetical protein Tp1102MES256162_38 [Prokaryotic dsDNA virus sp.]|tara:strand:+ start:78 stop:821 length:744 start_codon:yes stop_codon:yes gene_type:complete